MLPTFKIIFQGHTNVISNYIEFGHGIIKKYIDLSHLTNDNKKIKDLIFNKF